MNVFDPKLGGGVVLSYALQGNLSAQGQRSPAVNLSQASRQLQYLTEMKHRCGSAFGAGNIFYKVLHQGYFYGIK